MIADRAVIDPDARVAGDVEVGPYSIIGPGVEIGEGCSIGSHVVIQGTVRIGRNNRIFPFCSIGGDPQDKKYAGEAESTLEIGEGNTIREFCTINRGTGEGGGVTRIGDHNWIMAYVHIAHDCLVGSHNVFANNATLAGHVKIDDYVSLGGFTGVHQFCHVGCYSFSAIASIITKDIPPYILVSGNPAAPSGLNRVGLQRHGFTSPGISVLKQAYRTVYREGLLLGEALDRLADSADGNAELQRFVEFIRQSSRGIAR